VSGLHRGPWRGTDGLFVPRTLAVRRCHYPGISARHTRPRALAGAKTSRTDGKCVCVCILVLVCEGGGGGERGFFPYHSAKRLPWAVGVCMAKVKKEANRGTQIKPEECEQDYADKRIQITGSNHIRGGNRVHVLTLNPSVRVL